MVTLTKKEYNKLYYQNNKEKIKGQVSEYKESHREEILEKKRIYSKKYRKTHKEQVKEYNKKYEKEHPNMRKEMTKKWVTNNPEKAKESQRKCKNKRNKEIKLEIKSLLGGHCSNLYNIDHSSFESHPEYFNVLQVDHVNGNGNKERKRTLEYYRKMLNKIKSGSKDYQLLCPTCNWIKRKVNKEENQHI